jgi:hypothetical protein
VRAVRDWRSASAGAAACLAAALAACPDARAAEWYQEGEFGQIFSYDDNIGLEGWGGESGSGKTSGVQSTSSIQLNSGVRTPATELSLTSLFTFNAFPGNSELDSNDQYFALQGKKIGERWSAGLAARYVRDTSRTSDVTETGNFILQNKRRNFVSIAPSLGYGVTHLDQFNLTPFYNYSHYGTDIFPDVTTYGVAAGWAHDLNQRTKLTTTASAARASSRTEDSTYYAVLFGATHEFSESLKGSLAVGPSVANTGSGSGGSTNERSSGSGTVAGYAIDAKLSYAFQKRLTFEGAVGRGLTPSTSTGELNEDTTLTIRSSYELYPRVFLETPIFYLHRDQVGSGSGQTTIGTQSRDYASIEPTVRWRIYRDWDLSVGYSFQWQSIDGGDAFGNAVFASLTYDLPRVTMSR